MKRKVEKTDVGVVVGRFQVPELHPGHVELIEGVVKEHDRVLIFLGLSAARVTRNNPLDFEARRAMIAEQFPTVEIHYIKDQKSDELWSKDLDSLLNDHVGPGQTTTLYGGRDAFLRHYSGNRDVQELERTSYTSGTEARKKVSRKTKSSSDFRAGVTWAAFNQYPRCFPTVDIAIIDKDKSRLLLGRKPGEDKFRFIGGFVDGKETFEHAARREVVEETHTEISDLQYITSMPIDDWRYRGEVDGIVTSFYVAAYNFGPPQPDDDIAELKWFELPDVSQPAARESLQFEIVDTHQPLIEALYNFIDKGDLT
jgi:bifunctional NMN adenylyltransferase/nudix hydrolase